MRSPSASVSPISSRPASRLSRRNGSIANSKRSWKGVVTVQETGESYPCEALGEQAMKILAAGGIKPLMRARFAKEKAEQKAE